MPARALVLVGMVLAGAGLGGPRPVGLQPVGLLLPPTLPELVYFFELTGDEGAEVTGAWIADDVGATAPPGFVIATTTLDVAAGGEASFTLSRPTAGWPLGRYRLDVAVNGRHVRTEWFVIQT